MDELSISYIAIRNIKTKKLVADTDFRYNPPRQKYMTEKVLPMLFTNVEDAKVAMEKRVMSNTKFELVKVFLTVKVC